MTDERSVVGKAVECMCERLVICERSSGAAGQEDAMTRGHAKHAIIAASILGWCISRHRYVSLGRGNVGFDSTITAWSTFVTSTVSSRHVRADGRTSTDGKWARGLRLDPQVRRSPRPKWLMPMC